MCSVLRLNAILVRGDVYTSLMIFCQYHCQAVVANTRPRRSSLLSGLIHFLSHSTSWALLADDLRLPGFKSRSGREFSVGWNDGRYAMRLMSRTDTEGPPVSSLNCDRCSLCSYDLLAG